MISALALIVTVQQGQTLSSIASGQGVSVVALESANPQITNANLIYAGESVNVPQGGSGSSTPISSPVVVATAPSGSFQSCVIQRESSGNPQASNGTHWGLYQFSPNLWELGGGNPADYGSAGAAEQTQVFDNIMANDINGGASNWAPYDGC